MPSATPIKPLEAPQKTWQTRLEDACREYRISAPKYQLVSDRRGGRTAWSSSVTVHNQAHSARFWYDGRNLHNAREDAAEVAYLWLTTPSSSPSSTGW
ncbi:hypothetical protein MAPG_07330 [Magnaporthiopsis poae ATCC 64411]|uniref:DRBM domain-containing protein n=1 Tax=Magnaporthiopsis poae (strain ATCC 64411 / 73-15) TaxID=644358 RepID=A0A0C4E4D7_MAGP6|nr:hypothetical protein MAPG_07330 [Magnaporthiopsis poae ATCC 64411]